MRAVDYRSKRKQDEIQPDERREIAVKLMLNHAELELLESARIGTKLSKAEIIRALAFNQKVERAPIVPEVNITLARDLGRSLGNLATVAGVMRAGKFVELEDARWQVLELQKILRGQK
jgi:hypothetical protein